MFVYGIGFGILFPAMAALIGDELPAHARGIGAGVFTAVFSLGATVGTISVGALTALQNAFGIHPFQAAAILIGIGIVWAILALTKTEK
jgi:MFS family permease